MDFRQVSAKAKVGMGVNKACDLAGVSSSAWYLYANGKRIPPARVIAALVRGAVLSKEEGADLMRTYHPDVAAML
jgi:hypothetical protein